MLVVYIPLLIPHKTTTLSTNLYYYKNIIKTTIKRKIKNNFTYVILIISTVDVAFNYKFLVIKSYEQVFKL